MAAMVIDSIMTLTSAEDEGNEYYRSATRAFDMMKLYVNIVRLCARASSSFFAIQNASLR
jgi:hypothetical protein